MAGFAEHFTNIGIEKGIQQGLHQGELAVLSRQLARRFGPLPENVQVRLQSASTEQLEIWADRVLDARTLDEVFGSDAN